MTGPLEGRTIIVTRPQEEAEELAAPFRELGAAVLLAPVIRIEPGDTEGLREAASHAAGGSFDWIAFTSAAGVRAWFDIADGRPRCRLAAVGAGTAEALRRRGLEPDLIPPRFTTEALGAAFPEGPGRVLLPRADIAPPDLGEALRAKGWDAVAVEAYRTRMEEGLPPATVDALAAGTVDAATFTSASTVEGFTRLTGARPPAACIGPVTATTARRLGFDVAAVADPHTVPALVQAVLGLLGRAARR